jgi:CRP-like cAMP-binding protein
MRRHARNASRDHISHPDKRTNAAGRIVQNEILLATPDTDFIRIQPCLEFLSIPRRQVLHEPNRKLRYVYFLNRGLVSLVVETANGKTVEVGVVGKEGVTGMASAAGLNRQPSSRSRSDRRGGLSRSRRYAAANLAAHPAPSHADEP